MAQEREASSRRAAKEAAYPGIDSLKRGHGLLSFRSRKLLLSSLSKRTGVTDVEKRSAVSTAPEALQLGRSRMHVKEVVHKEQTKAYRELWDPMRVEGDSANARAKSMSRKTRKQLPIKEEQGKDALMQKDGRLGAVSEQQLPPKFKLLKSFYEGLEVASSLLRIRHQMCTLKAVCKIVESMSKRRFLLKHLAQIKHIFPDILLLEYVRCQDPDSWGEKWDLRITLLPLPSDCAHTNSPLKGLASLTVETVRRRKEFNARLLDFACSHLEDGDIPQEQLPLRPLGGQLPQSSSNEGQSASSSRRPIPESPSCDPISNQEPAVGSTDAGSPTRNQEEVFQFSVVKPACADAANISGGTPHFPASFRPFFSVRQTADAVDCVHHLLSEPVQPEKTLSSGSHFLASFRPVFSVKHSAEVIPSGLVRLPKTSLPAESLPDRSCNNDRENESVVESRVGSGDGVLPSRSVSANSSNLPETTCHLTPSFTPVFSVSSKHPPPISCAVESSPVLLHRESLASPAPVHTPFLSPVHTPFLSPKNFSFRAVQDSPKQEACKAPSTSSLNHPLPPKSQGIMRSLRFGSPVKSSSSSKAFNSDIAPRPPVESSMNASLSEKSETRLVHTSPSAPPRTPDTCHSERANVVQASPITPTTTANALQGLSSVLSPAKTSSIRSLQFDTLAEARSDDSMAAKVTTRDTAPYFSPASLSATAAKPPRFVSPPRSLVSCPPQTPGLQTPVRNSFSSKEVLYSPPKRTKLNRGSLFVKGDEVKDHEPTSITVFRTACRTKSSSEAVAGDIADESSPAGGRLEETTTPSTGQRYSAVKNSKGIPESDFDIVKCLPVDLVQSVLEKERRMKDESSRELAKYKRRQLMMGGIPQLFSQLRLIFQSLNRSVLPGQDLVKSVLASHPDITDKGEIEERLQLVIELAPEYITTRSSHSGELLYRIDKRADVVEIQRRLSSAC